MKKGSQHFVVSLAIILVFFCMLACKDSSKTFTYITEDDIWNIMGEVEVATLNKDIEGVIKHMAPSIVIYVTVNSPFGPQKVPMSREEYKEETLKGWAITSHNEYRRENEEIKISDDGQVAIVQADIIESYVLQGKTINTTTHERVTLEIIDGEILVTKINASVSMF